jgi:hypothetical protein
MPISQVALSNTFNEFRSTFNDAANTVNSLTSGGGDISANSITSSTLTSGRVPVVSTAGLIVDDSNLTYNTSTDVLTLGGATDASSTTTGTLIVTGGAGIAKNVYVGGNMQVTGNLTILGSNTSLSTTVLNIEDNILQLAHLNPSDVIDIGFIGGYNNGANVHSGLFRDATDDTWKLFRNYTAEPSTTIDVSANGFAWANLAIGQLTTANNVNVATGQSYQVNGTSVLNATTLGSSVVTSSLTTVGTIGSGAWQGTTIGTAYGGTGLTSFTANGVVYASSSSALTTNSALTFDGTNVFKVLAATGIAYNRAESTQHSTFVQHFATSGGTGLEYKTLYRFVDTDVGELMRLTSTGLGIGRTSPSAPLNVQGEATGGLAVRLNGRSSDNYSELAFWNNANSTNYGILGADQAAMYFGTNASLPLLFTTNSAERMRLTSAGSLVVGGTEVVSANGGITATTTSSGSLAAAIGMRNAGTSNGSGTTLTFRGVSNVGAEHDYAYVTGAADDTTAKTGSIRFSTTAGSSPIERMRITSAGNVGIGTTAPAAKLDVRQTSFTPSSSASNVIIEDKTTWSQGLQFYLNDAGTYASSNPSGAIGTSNSFQLFQTGGAFIVDDPSGANGLQATTTAASMYRVGNALHSWYGNTGLTAGSSFTATLRAQISAAGGFSVGTASDPGAGAIYATGNITAFFSDKRLKTVSGKIENALDKVAQLSGVYYTFNDTAKSFGYDSDEVQVGVLAQDVEAVLPQIVKAAPFDLDENNNSKSGENYKTVQYEKLVPLLIEAINELQAKVKALETK